MCVAVRCEKEGSCSPKLGSTADVCGRSGVQCSYGSVEITLTRPLSRRRTPQHHTHSGPPLSTATGEDDSSTSLPNATTAMMTTQSPPTPTPQPPEQLRKGKSMNEEANAIREVSGVVVQSRQEVNYGSFGGLIINPPCGGEHRTTGWELFLPCPFSRSGRFGRCLLFPPTGWQPRMRP